MPVQDLGYPTDCSMFPPPRHQSSSPYNMNTLGAFGYGPTGHQGQFAQDYGQFPVTDPGLQQQASTQASRCVIIGAFKRPMHYLMNKLILLSNLPKGTSRVSPHSSGCFIWFVLTGAWSHGLFDIAFAPTEKVNWNTLADVVVFPTCLFPCLKWKAKPFVALLCVTRLEHRNVNLDAFLCTLFN